VDSVFYTGNMLSIKAISGKERTESPDKAVRQVDRFEHVLIAFELHFQHDGQFFGVDFIGLFLYQGNKLKLVGIGDDHLVGVIFDPLDKAEGVGGGFHHESGLPVNMCKEILYTL
jgi:hypothetical protein